MKAQKYSVITFLMICTAVICAILLSPKASGNKSHAGTCTVSSQRDAFDKYANKFYNDLRLDTSGLRLDIFKKGLTGYYSLKRDGRVNKPILSLIDFRLPSSEKRLWVISLDDRKLLFHSLVAHGKNSGEEMASYFSNAPSSNMSSIGFYTTSTIYQGENGASLRLDGMDKGFNDNARSRDIVIHAADYVSQNFIDKVGRAGRSHGCPAVPNAVCNKLICTICQKSCLFIYSPDKNYESKSVWLKQEPAVAQFTKENPVLCMLE